MKNFQTFKCHFLRTISFIVITTSIFLICPFMYGINSEALAATNLIKNGSFEDNIDSNWGIWQKTGSARTYDLYRAYDAAFGFGSYSAAIDAKGTAEEAFSAILSSNPTTNKFTVQANKSYYLIFSAKSSQPTDVIAYLQRTDNFNKVTDYQARTLSTKWEKYIMTVTPDSSADCSLAFVFGNMPNGATMFIDGVQLFEANLSLGTSEVRGYIGENNKFIKINNIANFTEQDVEIELPYYDNLTGQVTTKRIHPSSLNSSGAYFSLMERTFSGIGRVFVDGSYIGQFNYNITNKITDYNPDLIRVDEDLIIFGSGFSPVASSTLLVVNSLNSAGKVVSVWLSPSMIDSGLSQLVFKLPAGITGGKLYIQTSFINVDGKEVVNKSNTLDYKVKPLIYATNWSKKGYEQVGDKLQISGKGMGLNPSVNFYDINNKIIESKKAKNLQVNGTEIVEVETTKKLNTFNISVLSNGVESDQSESLRFYAKPKLAAMQTKYSRQMYNSTDKLQAAKVGDEITLTGNGFRSSASSSASVTFQGNSSRIEVAVSSDKIAANGTSLKVVVPTGALNGYLNVRVNNTDSNYLPIEIIPTVVSISPSEIIPGQSIAITTDGVGDNLNLASVFLNTGLGDEITVKPYAIDASRLQAVIYINVPMALSSKYNTVNVQYDHWRDDGASVLSVSPTITSASINMDNKILSIKGYGFSIYPKENIITYKLADENRTVTAPKVKILGIYPSEEGQEIRVQILDDYHYGYVSVQVGDKLSNEVNFGPVSVSKISRRIELVPSLNRVMGVLYISGYNFGTTGGVKVGEVWADVHYRSNFYIIAVVEQANLNDNPVIIAR